MPITGEVDISGILANLGDPQHGLAPKRLRPPDELEEIFCAADGPIDMSTSVALAVIPKIIWDVNGYYAQLNIDKPYTPTKRQLRQAFQAVNGHDDERTTFVMMQLLDKGIRAEYDAMPLGSHFYDKYTELTQMRQLSEVAKEMSESSDTLVTVNDLMADFEAREEFELPLPSVDYPWDWGFYTHQSRKYDTTPLERWQKLLITAFAEREITTTISIGYVGKTKEDFDVRVHEGRRVIFLNDEIVNPTIELAETAVSKYIAQSTER